MKTRQFIVICILIISGFGLLYYQIHSYGEDMKFYHGLILWNTNETYANSVSSETHLEIIETNLLEKEL